MYELVPSSKAEMTHCRDAHSDLVVIQDIEAPDLIVV